MRNTLWMPLLITAMFGITPVEAQKLYKWVDEEGSVHFSETPRNTPGHEAVIIVDQPEPEAEVVEKTPVEIPEPTDLAASQQAAQLCQGLLDSLELYKSGEPIMDSEGNPTVVSPEMRETKIIEINAELDRSCR